VSLPLISVITWDAAFRESFHWFDSMQAQSYPFAEFIWSEFYTPNSEVLSAAGSDGRTRLATLANEREEPWHLGKCINHGVQNSKGDWLVLTDGDIVVEHDFLELAIEEHRFNEREVAYFRRYDEPEVHASDNKLDIGHYNMVGVLNNPTNFGACALLHRSVFDGVGGYEEHPAFCGAGISSLEFNVRLRNYGVGIRWSSIPTYHPWHSNTGASHDPAAYEKLCELAVEKSWLRPYAGVEQSWIVHCRDIELDRMSSVEKCDAYLETLPNLSL
jgi:glycosyl transferase family 2